MICFVTYLKVVKSYGSQCRLQYHEPLHKATSVQQRMNVENEPDWRVVLRERLLGYSNRLNRRPRLTQAGSIVIIMIRSRQYSDDITDEEDEN